MSAINFQLFSDRGYVAVDTLATFNEGQPCYFTSKAIPLPHLNMLIAVTGVAVMLTDFLADINNRVIRGPEDLAFKAPELLQKIWMEYRGRGSLGPAWPPENHTATIFHFGFSEETGQMVGYQHHSGNDFAAEALSGKGGKPDADLAGEPLEGLPENLRLLIAQQHADEQRPDNERVHIGGNAIGFIIQKGGMAIVQIAPLPGEEDVRKAILGFFH